MKVCGAMSSAIMAADKGLNIQNVSFETIMDNIVLDPAVSGDDIYLISANEVKMNYLDTLKEALLSKPQKVLVVFLCSNNEQQNRIDSIINLGIANVEKMYITANMDENLIQTSIRKIVNAFTSTQQMNDEIIKETDTSVYHEVSVQEAHLPFPYTPGIIRLVQSEGDIDPSQSKTSEESNLSDQATINPDIKLKSSSTERQVEAETFQDRLAQLQKVSAEIGIMDQSNKDKEKANIQKIIEQYNIDDIKESLSINAVMRNLHQESYMYKNLREYMDVIAEQIRSILMSPELNKTQRLDAIVSLLRMKQEARSKKEEMEVDRFIETLNLITQVAEEHITLLVAESENRYAVGHLRKMYYQGREEIDELMKKRFDEQIELNKLVLSLKKTVTIIESSKEDMIDSISSPDMTNSPVIDSALIPEFGNTLADNAIESITKILAAVEQSEVKFAAVSERISKAMKSIHNISKLDQEINDRTEYLNKLLVANRIEETVQITNPLKLISKLYVGGDNIGKTATAYIDAKLNSRKFNTALIDLTPTGNLSRYTDTIKFEDVDVNEYPRVDFLTIRTENKYCSLDKLKALIESLTSHYKSLVMIIDCNQKELYNYLKDVVLSVNYVLDDSLSSIQSMKPLLQDIELANTAIKIIDMATELTPIQLSELYGYDPLKAKHIKVPRLPQVRQATLKGIDPLQFDTVEVAMRGLLN